MRNENESVNVINEVLSSPKGGDEVLPTPLATGEEVLASAVETMNVYETLAAPRLTDVQRRSFAAQSRPSQAAVTGICARILDRSPRVATKAALPPQAVANLLRFETGLGAVRRAGWPLVHYGLLRYRQSGQDLDNVLQEIETSVKADSRLMMTVALGQSEGVQARQDQSDNTKKARKKAQKQQGQQVVSQQKQSLDKKKATETLVSDVTAGKARARLPARPATVGDTTGKAKGKTGKTRKATGSTGKVKGKTSKTGKTHKATGSTGKARG